MSSLKGIWQKKVHDQVRDLQPLTRRHASGIRHQTMTKGIVLDVFLAKNQHDYLCRVRPQDPSQQSFVAIVARFSRDKLDEIKEGALVLLQQLEGLNLPAVVDVVGQMPMPLQLEAFQRQEEMEWAGPEDLMTQKQVVEIMEVMQAQMLRVMRLAALAGSCSEGFKASWRRRCFSCSSLVGTR